eukprot:8920640-Karenia_brevis.AAC.1
MASWQHHLWHHFKPGHHLIPQGLWVLLQERSPTGDTSNQDELGVFIWDPIIDVSVDQLVVGWK